MDGKQALRDQLDGATFRKSSLSGPYSDNCVEVALLDGGGAALRDSKNNGGPVLVFTDEEWAAFVGGAKLGEFDPS